MDSSNAKMRRMRRDAGLVNGKAEAKRQKGAPGTAAGAINQARNKGPSGRVALLCGEALQHCVVQTLGRPGQNVMVMPDQADGLIRQWLRDIEEHHAATQQFAAQ